MVVDARSNDIGPFSSLLNRPRASQALSLEGDFDTHFRLYAPKGYETDALYVFTPDFMALLIDESGDLDVEIRDDRLIVTKPGGFDLHSPQTWARFEALRALLGSMAWERTALYTDERTATALDFGSDSASPVAEEGIRLRTRAPRALALFIAIPVGVLAIIATVGTLILSAVFR